MPRTVKPWIGRNDDAMPPPACKRRILAKQGDKSAISGRPFTAKEKPEFDHIVPLWLDGKNCEENLQAIHRDEHRNKTATEATVRARSNAAKDKNLGLSNRRPSPLSRKGPKERQPLTKIAARKFDVFGRRVEA